MTDWAHAGVDGAWLRPAVADGPGGAREPRWGHPDGMQIGLHPLSGPRGLIRIYTPYLGHSRDRLLNFIAVEPTPVGAADRGYSELERSVLDDVPGLRFWTADDPADATPRMPDDPSRGIVTTDDHGIERLVVHILVERFANGADVWVTAAFAVDRPHEVTLAASARPTSARLETCILSATMGNWARLRRLELAGGAVTAGELWPDYRDVHFADRTAFPLDGLAREDGAVVVRAVPDEAQPHLAEHAAGTAEHWRYLGARGVQSWVARDPDPALYAQVNGRYTDWMSEAPIPGGIAFENIELVEPFRQGRELTFRAEPL